MKKYITVFFLILSLAISGASSINSYDKILPAFTYSDLSGKKFTSSKIPKKKEVIIMFFNPNCPYSRAQTKVITENQDSLKDVQIILISPHSLSDIKVFTEENSLQKFKNVKVLQDVEETFTETFTDTGFPALYLYDKNQKFRILLRGQTSIEDLLSGLMTENITMSDSLRK